MMLGQDWVSAAGIALDFAGFSLLLREWWLAFFNEAAQIRMAESLERQRAMRDLSRGHHPPGTPNPFAPLERIEDAAAIRRARATHLRAMASRRKVFIAAAALIVLGFLLQLAGAIPGCCPLVGIAPSGA